MSNTIERALQRQKEAQQKKLQEIAESAEETQNTITPEDTSEQLATSKATVDTASQSELEPFKLDREWLQQAGLVSLSDSRSKINEEYREIKRKLLRNAFGGLAKTLNNSNIIMVTSSRPSEGKTFTATNLALSIAAEQDKTVLLVDADVLKPNVLNTLGLEKRPGIMEYLLGEKEDIADVLYPTSIDKLKIIPAGKSHHLSTELLASQKMHDIVDEFANRYSDRVVIFDTPPLIGINESAILANFAGQAVVVVEEGKSKIGDIKLAVERLNPDMAIGFVVNKSINSDSEGTGYYGYYYTQREA
ncbi:XrtA-associated tyrosine autokinase [Aestuariibacter salexigens]|uniref:XrtA-associated tyrosine autokinase n=1 Tax=Aestuariibacter salexigens TaxID=226010 RepID=UPI000478B7F8|nr:XrtA-associated tyrosine autokinase [Aestuariibacter salexigens]